MGLELYRFEIRNLVTESSKNGSEKLKYNDGGDQVELAQCFHMTLFTNSQNIVWKRQFRQHNFIRKPD